VTELLPRVRDAELLEHLGHSDLFRRVARSDQLCESAMAALALPHLRGNARAVRRARRAVVHLEERRSNAELADMLGVSTRTVQRARREPRDAELALRAAPGAIAPGVIAPGAI
jgi:hypothetical protein